jgi:hypothetical protein
MNEDFEYEFAMRKVSRLNESLEARFGLSLDLHSVDHLREVYEHYHAKRDFLIARHGYADAFVMEDYAKAVMISEAIALILREISPSRLKPRTRLKGTKKQ